MPGCGAPAAKLWHDSTMAREGDMAATALTQRRRRGLDSEATAQRSDRGAASDTGCPVGAGF
jgi:hypothetical protein